MRILCGEWRRRRPGHGRHPQAAIEGGGRSATGVACAAAPAGRLGTACVEFALVLPILMAFILGVLEIGRYVDVYQVLNAAAREGARQASSGKLTNAQVVNVVTGCVRAAGLPTANLTVTVADLTNAGTDVSQATTLDNLQVTVSLPYNDVRWITTSDFTTTTTRISSTVFWVSSNPQSYPSTVSAPTGS